MIGLSIKNPGFLGALTLGGLKLDTSFNFSPVNGLNATINTVGFQSDGKIIVAGNFTDASVTNKRIYRLNTDGSLDTSFIVRSSQGFSASISKVFVLPDDKILVGGDFNQFNVPSNPNHISLLNSDGSTDDSTNLGQFQQGGVYDIVRQSDGKLIMAGGFQTYNGTTTRRIIRLNADYSIDENFNTNIGTSISSSNDAPSYGITYITVLKIQPDGKILIGGFFNTFNGVSQNCLTRINSDGTLDTTFASNIGTAFERLFGNNPVVSNISIQSDGKILVGGVFTSFNDVTSYGLVRLNPDGTRDFSFNNDLPTFNIEFGQYPTINESDSVLSLSNDDILFAGRFNKYNPSNPNNPTTWSLALSNSTGTTSLLKKLGSFNIEPNYPTNAESVYVQPDGKIYVSFTSVNNSYLYRFLPIE